jgi:hypothetical protein
MPIGLQNRKLLFYYFIIATTIAIVITKKQSSSAISADLIYVHGNESNRLIEQLIKIESY